MIFTRVIILTTAPPGFRGAENQPGDLQLPLKKYQHDWRWSSVCRISTFNSRRDHAAGVCADAESHYFSSITARKLLDKLRHSPKPCRMVQVNHQVINKEERCLLSRVIDVMVALELRFIQEKQEDCQMMYRLDPYVGYYVHSSITDIKFQSHRRLYHL